MSILIPGCIQCLIWGCMRQLLPIHTQDPWKHVHYYVHIQLQIAKKALIPIPNWYVEMDIPNQHGYVCGWWIPYVRWDQIHMTMWNEADISRGLLDFCGFNPITFYLFIHYYYGTNGENSLQTQTKKECGSCQPQTGFYFMKKTHNCHLL